ncbi:ribosome maturation factor RimP [bacterium]|nr:ribosome maturation factor RimP [bacterium]
MELEEQLAEACAPALAAAGLELVLVEVAGLPRRRTVRLYIDKPEGVDVEDCARASRLVDPLIEAAGVLTVSWVLEVSSPGLERPLVKAADYERFTGRKARLKLKRPLLENRRNLTGTLLGLDGQGRARVQLEGSEEVQVELENVARANLIYEWK